MQHLLLRLESHKAAVQTDVSYGSELLRFKLMLPNLDFCLEWNTFSLILSRSFTMKKTTAVLNNLRSTFKSKGLFSCQSQKRYAIKKRIRYTIGGQQKRIMREKVKTTILRNYHFALQFTKYASCNISHRLGNSGTIPWAEIKNKPKTRQFKNSRHRILPNSMCFRSIS